MTRAKLLEQKQFWITLAIIFVTIRPWPVMKDTPGAIAENPQIKQASDQIQQNDQFKTINVQVSNDADTAEVAKVMSPEQLDSGITPLHDYYFYLDPGHNAAGGPPDPTGTCNDRGTGGWQPNTNLVEGDLTWNVAFTLQQYLIANGVPQSQIFMSRPTANTYVTVRNRVDGTNPNDPCSTYGNDQLFRDKGSPTNRWRFISIHLNASGGSTERVEVFRKARGWGFPTIPLADEFAENMSWQLNRPYPHPNSPYSGDWTLAGNASVCSPEPVPCDLYVVRYSLPRAFDDTRNVCVQNGWCHHGSYNILAELGYLDNPGFNAWIASSSNQQAEAKALLRGLGDFLVAGRPGMMQNKDTQLFDGYRLSILGGLDPGMPFDNGGGYYAHQWGNALTQEFLEFLGTTKGSVLKPIGGGTAHYVRNPIWSTYIQKGGPNGNGPGLPTGDEHSWTTKRRANGRDYTYPKTMNFERGAIAWNSYEGGMSTSYDQHALFLANCSTPGIDDGTFGFWLKGLAQRFSLSNDLTTAYDPNTGGYTGGYTSVDLAVYDPANRAEIAQALVWTESFNDSGTNWPYTDIPNHWARPLINIAADHSIANGYITNPPCNQGIPCWKPNDNVSRQQFSKMESIARGWALVNPGPSHAATTLCPTGYNSFADGCYNSTFYQHVETVKAHNAIDGYPCGGPGEPCDGSNTPYFRPGNSVTRGQMSKIIDQSLRTDGVPPPFGCWYEDFPGSDN